jgi:hypothetical protein
MKLSFVVGWILGIVVLAVLVLLWAEGNGGAGAIVLTAVGIVAMIVLGSLMGGRRTPQRAPQRPGASVELPDPPHASEPASEPASEEALTPESEEALAPGAAPDTWAQGSDADAGPGAPPDPPPAGR